jgi:hypothetical protein
MKHKIIFVHGFGVKKDARGLFADIVNTLQNDPNMLEVECVLTDLNIVSQENNDIILNPLSKQAQILREVFERESGEGVVIDLVCHSQGCVVGAIADLPGVRKVVLMTPPVSNDFTKTLEFFKSRPDTVINLEGESYLTRADGSRTIAPKEYWQDRQDINYLEEYKRLAEHNDVTTIIANQDEVVSNESVGELSEIGEVIRLDSDHNFTGEARQRLIETLKDLLAEKYLGVKDLRN